MCVRCVSPSTNAKQEQVNENNILDPEEMLMRELTILVIENNVHQACKAVEDDNPFYFDYQDLVGGIVFPEGWDHTGY